MDSMTDNFDLQDDPQVGIFWYDEAGDELFGVTKAYAGELQFNHNGLKTVKTLHRDWWKQQRDKARYRGKAPRRFQKGLCRNSRGQDMAKGKRRRFPTDVRALDKRFWGKSHRNPGKGRVQPSKRPV